MQGSFTFNQEGVTPNDELFNVFGTAILSMCSKPAPELAAGQDGVATYFVNVGERRASRHLSELNDEEQEALMGLPRAPRGRPSARRPSSACRWRRWWAWPTSRTA